LALSASFEALLQELITLRAPPLLIKQVAQMDASELVRWIETVDESPYSIGDWASALILFAEWEVKERALSLKQKREYLVCCIEGCGGSTSLLPLSSLLESYLHSHGVRD
jgi:hypothetical protein